VPRPTTEHFWYCALLVRTRKALGQHFLTDTRLLADIAAATGAGPAHVVLEIGPGPGGLTAALLATGAAVVAIERDPRLHETLRRRFAHQDFALAAGDALEMDWLALVTPWLAIGRRWIVAGNIPYNLTSPLLQRALTPPWPEAVTFLVQREVAERITALPGSEAYGALSINIQAVAVVERGMAVGREAFTPVPKVDSSLIRLVPRTPSLLPPDAVTGFRRLVTSIFSYRRKRMLKAVREALALDATAAAALLEAAALDPDVRPEQIGVDGYLRLLRAQP
jgi:16S rRNA (adenine1518-N6/adenine1519-N6)-dimethyltransferase